MADQRATAPHHPHTHPHKPDKAGTDRVPEHGVPPSDGEHGTGTPNSDREHTEHVADHGATG